MSRVDRQVGWMVMLDGRTVGLGCASTPGEVRVAVGVEPHDVAVVIGRITEAWAAAQQATCVQCGRPLAECASDGT